MAIQLEHLQTLQEIQNVGQPLYLCILQALTNRVICDSSTLDATAKSSGISDSLIAADTEVGTITSGADGTFSQIKLSTIATGNTYTLSVSGKTKTRRLRIAKSGTSTLLRWNK
jgi:hypothetical protein